MQVRRLHRKATERAETQSWWNRPPDDNLAALECDGKGLSSGEAALRLRRYGRNIFRDKPPPHLMLQFLARFRNPLILLLLFAGVLSALFGDAASAGIITAMVVFSAALDFVQEYRAGQAAERLKQAVALRAVVVRDSKPIDIDAQELVPGDLVTLGPGQLVPADGCLMSARDLFVKQTALTGESYPVEKSASFSPGEGDIQSASNALFMGTTIVSGEAKMVVCATGLHSQVGAIHKAVVETRSTTAFEQGISRFGDLILRATAAMSIFVVIVNALAHKPLLESLMFTLALAVGLTPELLPMIVTLTLTRGAMRLARERVIVKRLSGIQDLGAIDIFCTDKTGTLTEGRIRLERHVDIHGLSDETVLRFAWLNCHFESGLRTPMEDAVLAHESMSPEGWRKIDEVPFDFERRRLSVLLAHRTGDTERRCLILKGAPEDVLAHCTSFCRIPQALEGAAFPLDPQMTAEVNTLLAGMEDHGFRTLALAVKEMPPERDHAYLDDEDELMLLGFLAFFDPPKESARDALKELAGYGIEVKVVTGDSERVAHYVCRSLGVPVDDVLKGREIADMSDEALRERVERTTLFCRVNPMQKNRVILALKEKGHAVGYLGDGINDAPALHNADAGISVDTAVDVAKEAADLILLESDLRILAKGVLEGRRTFSNVRKYLMMGTSSNFGNMFSMAGAAVLLPFLPMLPVQILLNNILYDISESVIPLDRVDDSEMEAPQRWNMQFLRNFMLTMGPVSSLFDFATFYVLLAVLHAGEQRFQTSWFVESMATQVLVIFVIRTRMNPFKSTAHPMLVATSLLVVAAAAALPYLRMGNYFGLVPLPSYYYVALTAITLLYLVTAEFAKIVFYRTGGASANHLTWRVP